MPEEDFEQLPSLDSAAVSDHELYSSWRRAGFDREQAFGLLLNNKQMIHQAAMQEAMMRFRMNEED